MLSLKEETFPLVSRCRSPPIESVALHVPVHVPFMDEMRLHRVVSGGQTGADRAALDAAMESGIPVGGWCPKHRRAEDGPIPDRYPLKETPSPKVEQRTAWNVRDSDGTLILVLDDADAGTNTTIERAQARGRPVRVVQLQGTAPADERIEETRRWMAEKNICVLNVAGPRESNAPGLYDASVVFLAALFEDKASA